MLKQRSTVARPADHPHPCESCGREPATRWIYFPAWEDEPSASFWIGPQCSELVNPLVQAVEDGRFQARV